VSKKFNQAFYDIQDYAHLFPYLLCVSISLVHCRFCMNTYIIIWNYIWYRNWHIKIGSNCQNCNFLHSHLQ